MAGYEQKDGQGVLFKNDKQGNEKRPDYTGTAKVDGKTYQLSAWIKEGQRGKFMSLSIQEPRQQQQEPRESSRPAAKSAEDEFSDVPF